MINFKKYLYILPLFLLIFVSCADEALWKDNKPGNQQEAGEGEFLFNFMVDGFGVRTRDVTFDKSALVKINSVWIGVFDYETGECVDHNKAIQNFIEINSNQEYNKFLRVKLPNPVLYPENDEAKKRALADRGKKLFMICVANYKDVNDESGNLLEDRLDEIQDWEDFMNIAVDTKSAYQPPHDGESPIMAGFLRIKDGVQRQGAHVQVDQFNQEDGIFHLFPEAHEGDLLINYDYAKGKYDIEQSDNNTTGHIFLLRRLVANINVNIKLDNSTNPDLKLTKVTYKRFNQPEAVYIVERRTVDNGLKPPPADEPDKASNYADKLWVESRGAYGYTQDDDWQINTIKNSDTEWSFNFQQFANKHWARHDVADYSAREEKELVEAQREEGDGQTAWPPASGYYYKALADGLDDFNNNASYFVIKMHLVDEKNNRCAEAEYTIHAGYCSNYDGTAIDQNTTDDNLIEARLKDFTVARNVSYNYEIVVSGFENIKLNVNAEGQEGVVKHHDQGGTIWQMYYANDIQNQNSHYYTDEKGLGHFINIVPGTGREVYGVTIDGFEDSNKNPYYYHKYEGAMTFAPHPNIAFRLYGYTTHLTREGQTVEEGAGIGGYNYNFERSSFDYLYGMWPQSAGDYSHYFMNDKKLDINLIPEDLRAGVIIKEQGGEQDVAMDIVNFTTTAMQATEVKTYDVYIRESELMGIGESELQNYVRAIYITDRNGIYDDDKCSRQVNVFCAAQYPDYIYQQFDMIYAGGMDQKFVPSSGGDYPSMPNYLTGTYTDEKGQTISYSKIGMVFTDTPDIAFRIIGRDEFNNPVDICYNCNVNDYPTYKDLWPEVTPYTVSVPKDALDTYSIPASLLEGLKIKSNQYELNIKEFVQYYLENERYQGDGFVVSPYSYPGEPEESMRALYVFDKNIFARNFLLESVQDNKKKATYQIYAAQQFPEDTRIEAPLVSALYHNRNVTDPTPVMKSAGFLKSQVAKDTWCGIINSMVEIEWQKVDEISSYSLQIGDMSPIMVSAGSNNIIKYPLVTANMRPGTYDVRIDPISSGDPFKPNVNNILTGKLVLTDSYWDFSKIDNAKNIIDQLATRENTKDDGKIPGVSDARGFANVNFELNGLHIINNSTACFRGLNVDGKGYCFQTVVANSSRTIQALMFYVSTSGTLYIDYSGVGNSGNGETGGDNRYFIFDTDGGEIVEKKGMQTSFPDIKTMAQHIDLPEDRDYTAFYIYSYKAFRYFRITFEPDN